MRSDRLPIGYWIKKADEALTKGIDATLAPLNVTRTDWQLLNTVHERPSLSKPELAAVLEPFADAIKTETLVARLQAENVLIEANGSLSLTDKGRQLHHACLEKQQAFRQNVMAGIGSDAHETTVQTLQKIIDNTAR